jgi:hypothetical protein
VRNNLVNEDPEQTESPREAAVSPLHQEEEYMSGWAKREPHLQAGAIVLPGKFSRPAAREARMKKRTSGIIIRWTDQLQ